MLYLKMKKRKSLLQFSDSQKEASFQTLNKYLVDFSNLSLITKQAHWNLQGKNFISVHEMLDDFYEMLQKYVDIFAERLIQLNFLAIATAEHLARNSSFQEYPSEISSSERYAPWIRSSPCSLQNNISPVPNNFSAPPWSIIVVESTGDVTLKAIRVGMLFFIVPLITSVDGLCVATIK